MKRYLALLIVCATQSVWGSVQPSQTAEPQSPEKETLNVLRDVERLASDAMAGRATGSEGERAAAEYIASELRALGAVPLSGFDDFRHPFTFTAGATDTGSSVLFEGETYGASDVLGLSFSSTDTVTGSVVFAGYGITVPDSQDFGYDSYFGLDVQDKVVLVLRYFPEDASQEARSILARYSGLRYKARNARERGAKGMILVTGPRSPNAGELVPLQFDAAAASSGIAAASISGALADRVFRSAGLKLEEAQLSFDDANPHVTGYALEGVEITLDTRLKTEEATGFNVLGQLPATSSVDDGAAGGPQDVVLMGAHYDHLGVDGQGGSLAKKEERGRPHLGADDNASGVAAVLQAARILSGAERDRDLVLGFWSGEEMGLLGSSAFLASGAVPKTRIVAYLNLDMVGRMRDNRLVLQAVGTSSIWKRVIEQSNVPVGFNLQLSDDPYLPTDSTAFNQAKIPTLNLFTGGHSEYHRPADRPDTLNYEDLNRVADFAALLGGKLALLEDRPDFIQVAQTKQEGGSRDSVRAFTGTIPDYASEEKGLLLGGVIEGGPAEQAGLRAGDIVIEFAGQTITNIYDYTYALDAVKIDVPIQVVFMRNGERREVTMTPRTRK